VSPLAETAETLVPNPQRRVAILYSHPLFGEGLGHLLQTDDCLIVQLVHVDDLETAEAALALKPDVVVLERGLPVEALDLLRMAPNALLIDVGLDAGPSWAYRREELSPQPDEILRTIRSRARTLQPRRRAHPEIPAVR
jgi:DNA-binding NarL/FixJ family response regulator